MKPVVYTLLAAAALLCAASCSVMCNKKNNLKNTRWKCEYQEFVADAGNETVTVTLRFLPSNKYIMETTRVMPSYPAMYMNPDGTVDTKPGWNSTYSSEGTYSVKGSVVTLVPTDGFPKTLTLFMDKLKSDELSYQTLVFTRE